MCPWREPESDLRALFPAANRRRTEVRILSGQRLELAKRLGRAPAAEEMALYFHRVYRGDRPLGTVLVRRVKGEYGAIEVVVGVGTDGKVRGVRLQRLREPEPIAEALRSPAWLGSFAGKTVAGAWTLGRDVPDVPAAARPSARAVMEGARSLVILLEVAERRGLPSEEAPHHH
jgi:Na+-translocating ferredoxin:NAD+ oxidoreductase RnfG subunit